MTEKKSITSNIFNSLGQENLEVLNDDDSTYKRGLLLRIIAIAATLTALFAILDSVGLHDMGTAQRYFNFIFSFSNFVIAIALQKRIINFLPACSLFLLLCYMGCISAVVNVPIDEFRAIWFFLTIFYAFMLRGVFLGYILTIGSVIALILIQIYVTDTYSELSFATIIIALVFYSVSLASFTKQLERHRQQLRKQSRELHYLANKDPLTDTLNSENHYIVGKSLLENAKKKQSELSMICVFIDNLSIVYQKHGLQIEAPLLTHVEKLINAQLYNKGDVAKVSQQEFCIILPECDILSAKSLAQKISESIQQHLFSTGKNKIPLTLSIGVTTMVESDDEIRSIQVRADKALNKAKAQGGNKTFTYSI